MTHEERVVVKLADAGGVRVAVGEVQPSDHDDVITGTHAGESVRERRVTLEPLVGRAL